MSEEALKKVILKPRDIMRIRMGHPWVYVAEVAAVQKDIKDGELVEVCDKIHNLIGTGFFNSHSKILVRLLSHNSAIEANEEFFTQRIQTALEVRKRAMPNATSFRVVNAESDFLSGLIIDKYEDILVIQTTSLGMDLRKDIIVKALVNIFNPTAILEKNDVASRTFEGMEISKGVLYGKEPEGNMTISLNGLKFNVNFQSGHKTGCYLDQQANYDQVSRLTIGKKVLDCFCFLGGFSLHAARAGALQVIGIDQSAEAVASAKENAQQNGLSNICDFQEANVFDWLIEHTHKELTDEDKYDLIVLDPPSFTRNRHSVDAALRGYKEIHLRALKLLRRNGILATFCCSHHVDTLLFQDVILEAAMDAHKTLRRIQFYGQSPDHPVIPIIPETEYLKGFAYEIANQ